MLSKKKYRLAVVIILCVIPILVLRNSNKNIEKTGDDFETTLRPPNRERYHQIDETISIPHTETYDTNTLNPRVFCIVLTTEKKLKDKARLAYEAWASKCDNHTFVSTIPNMHSQVNDRIEIKYENLFNLLKPKNFHKEDYWKLTDKVHAAIGDVYVNQKNYDWYLKADDDTFILMDNLRMFLKSRLFDTSKLFIFVDIFKYVR